MPENYIQRLQRQLAESEAARASLRCGIRLLRSYLQSPKFHDDTTVQVRDVLMRLEEAENLESSLRAE